jgi:hypothetical protein
MRPRDAIPPLGRYRAQVVWYVGLENWFLITADDDLSVVFHEAAWVHSHCPEWVVRIIDFETGAILQMQYPLGKTPLVNWQREGF